MKILITECTDFSREAVRKLSEHHEVHERDLQSQDELLSCIGEFDVVFVRLRFRFDSAILVKAERLKYILTATTGLDHIDTGFFAERGGAVISLKGQTDFLATVPSTAEHTWALLLALVRNLPQAFADVVAGHWQRDRFKGHNLKGLRIGVLGLGRVGSQVAGFAKAFGMSVGYFDSIVQTSDYVRFEDAASLFSWAQIITIHIPGDAANSGFVDASLLAHTQKGVVLVNTSRANVWDEQAVAQLVEDGHLSGVATDVLSSEFSPESQTTNPLVRLAAEGFRVIITPHIAGATYESMEMTENFVVMKFLEQTLK